MILMGWFFGPSIKERNRGGRIEYYGKCDACGNEQSGPTKGKVESALNKCEKDDNKDAARREAENKRQRAAAQEMVDNQKAENLRQKQIDRLKQQRLTKAKQIRRAAKGKKCPWCGKNPCKGTKPDCAAVKAAEFESAFDIDVSNQGTFNKQLRWYERELGRYDGHYPEE